MSKNIRVLGLWLWLSWSLPKTLIRGSKPIIGQNLFTLSLVLISRNKENVGYILDEKIKYFV